MIEIITQYEPKRYAPSKVYDDGITQQQFADEVNVHKIIDRYAKTGVLPSGTRQALFGDFSQVTDYQTSLDMLRESQEAFASLPAKVKDRFGNDPAQLMRFIANDENRDEAIALGLIDKPVDPDATLSDVVAALREQKKAGEPVQNSGTP